MDKTCNSRDPCLFRFGFKKRVSLYDSLPCKFGYMYSKCLSNNVLVLIEF